MIIKTKTMDDTAQACSMHAGLSPIKIYKNFKGLNTGIWDFNSWPAQKNQIRVKFQLEWHVWVLTAMKPSTKSYNCGIQTKELHMHALVLYSNKCKARITIVHCIWFTQECIQQLLVTCKEVALVFPRFFSPSCLTRNAPKANKYCIQVLLSQQIKSELQTWPAVHPSNKCK